MPDDDRMPGDDPSVIVFAGPCVIESLETCLVIAERLVVEQEALGDEVHIVFKSSFDKANRTSASSFRGPGLDEGLEVLAKVKAETGLEVITDVHESDQPARVAQVADYLQVPAFLCRQTDLLVAAAATGRPVMVKKGQFLDPHNTPWITDKLRRAGCRDVLLCERGTTFGYGDLVVDFRSLIIMREPGVRVVYDATHSVQLPGALQDRSDGQPEFIVPLASAAAAVGCDGFFFETHPEPERALSDGPNSLRLDVFGDALRRVLHIRSAALAVNEAH